MLALGYSSFVAIALPALGYDALCTYALLGVPVVVFSGFVGQPVDEVGGTFSPASCRSSAPASPWACSGSSDAGSWSCAASSPPSSRVSTAGFIAIGMNALQLITLTGVAAGIGVILVMLVYLLILP